VNSISLFSGIGGFDLGFAQAGISCHSVCEKDKQAQNILRRHLPGAGLFDDVKDVGKDTHGKSTIDIIYGGFPCQDVSIAGQRKGLAGERSGLWFEFARVIDEIEPRWVIVENVPGLLSSNEGKDFAVIIRWLAERGYGVAWRILDAQYFGVPQRRRRVFVVASLGNGRAAEVLFESEGGAGDNPPRREAGKSIATTFTIRSGKEGGGKGYLGLESLANTLGGQPQYMHHYVMAHGQANAEIVSDGSPSLTTNHEAPIVWHNKQSAGEIRVQDDIAPTMSRTWGTGGNNVPFVGVRRLTPTECERLQGFPDNFTEWGIDKNGKRVDQKDSVRYRQLGNAVAVPVAAWIGGRIMNTEMSKT
jgi:DNA (cytosine-5)-methyltransferase 1